MPSDFKRRQRFIADQVCAGATREQALEAWAIAHEIGQSFENDGIRTKQRLSQGEVADAIDDYLAIKELGL